VVSDRGRCWVCGGRRDRLFPVVLYGSAEQGMNVRRPAVVVAADTTMFVASTANWCVVSMASLTE
jgi:hypothetical protein